MSPYPSKVLKDDGVIRVAGDEGGVLDDDSQT